MADNPFDGPVLRDAHYPRADMGGSHFDGVNLSGARFYACMTGATFTDTNLSGAVRCCRHAVPHLLRSDRGRIINITSIAGIAGSGGQANYSAAKAGMIGLTEVLARELAPQGVTVNAVAPGAIDAGIVAAMPEDLRRKLLEVIPMGRMGTAEEVAALVVFLASREAGYITGQTIAVDGGTTGAGKAPA